MTPLTPQEGSRPAVSVIVPFRGAESGAVEAARQLARLAAQVGDELLLVDNSPDGTVGEPAVAPLTLIRAPELASPYHARNIGADHGRNPWLLFTDADCRPEPGLLDRYFEEAVPDACGALAGSVAGAAEQRGVIPRYIRSRRHLDQELGAAHAYKPMAVTANLLVRREAWESIGGFCDEVRSGADADFCWRLQEAGWTLGYRPAAVVEHFHRESLAALVRQSARDGAGKAWLNRRHPGSERPPRPVRELVRSLLGAIVWAFALRPERALFKLLDTAMVWAESCGYLLDNVAPRELGHGDEVAVVEEFPGVSASGRVEAFTRPARIKRSGVGPPAWYLEDDGAVRRFADLAWLLARHPFGSVLGGRAAGAPPLRMLAPAARRIARHGERRLSAGPSAPAEAAADRLRRLLNL